MLRLTQVQKVARSVCSSGRCIDLPNGIQHVLYVIDITFSMSLICIFGKFKEKNAKCMHICII